MKVYIIEIMRNESGIYEVEGDSDSGFVVAAAAAVGRRLVVRYLLVTVTKKMK